MSEANTNDAVGQGRFGPPPMQAFTVTAFVERGDRWRLKISTGRHGQQFETTVDWRDAGRSDVVEAIVVEAYRVLRG